MGVSIQIKQGKKFHVVIKQVFLAFSVRLSLSTLARVYLFDIKKRLSLLKYYLNYL